MNSKYRANFTISFYRNSIGHDRLVELFNKLALFKVYKYEISEFKDKRIKKDQFYYYLENIKNVSSNVRLTLLSSIKQNDFLNLYYYKTTNVFYIYGGIGDDDFDIWHSIENTIFDFAVNNHINSSSIRLTGESMFNELKHPSQIQRLRPDIKEIKMKGNFADPEQFPAHTHNIDGLWFGCCYEMWFGRDYDKYIPLDKIRSFDRCKQNETLDNGTVHIVLYDSPDDYASEKSVANAWAFRRHTECDKAADYWEAQVRELSKGLNDQVYEIEEGKFPHGGIRLLKTYLDENGKHVPKHEAVKVHISERGTDGKTVFAETVELNKI